MIKKEKIKIECKEHHFEAQKIDTEIIILCTRCGMVIDDKREWPLKEGEREMWAILGTSGGIYGFASSSHKAKDMQKNYWNIGNKPPIKYLIKFKRL